MSEVKTIKDYCKEAKKRLKTGFWEKHNGEMQKKLNEAILNGLSENKVKEYFSEMAQKEIKQVSLTDEAFYQKVKEILINEGEVSNAIGRLTDREVFDKLSYEEKQRYTLSISEKYLKAVERFNREKELIKT